jgi:hypothetical protein
MMVSCFRKTVWRGPVPRCGLLLALGLVALAGSTSPAWGGAKPGAGRAPKLREVAEVPEDYFGRTFTYTVRVSTNYGWMRRAGDSFFLFIQDVEGNKLPNRCFSPESTVNYFRFVLPKGEGKRLIDRLNPDKMYEARIRFTVDRERALLGQGWLYLGKITRIELR